VCEDEEHGEVVLGVDARLNLVESRIRTIAGILDSLNYAVGTLTDASINIFQGHNEAERELLLERVQENAEAVSVLMGRIRDLLAAVE
jgi:hypothetical protein